MSKKRIAKNTAPLKPSGTKKFLYSIILVTIAFILLFLLEVVLRIVNYGDNFRLFVDYPGEEIQRHLIINPIIGKKYFQKLEYTNPCHDMFLKEKPENGFRIFVLGSSTVLGFPYDENLMFTRILQERLEDSYPERKVEVINTALTAINSYTLFDFTDDILKQEPDAIIIYAGHNEFYGAMGIGSVEKALSNRRLTLLHCDLLALKIYQLMRNMIAGIGNLTHEPEEDQNVRGTLMKVIAKNEEIPYKSKVYNKGIDIYEKNIGKILQKAKRKNVPVFISEVVSNVKDLEPFCSSATTDYPLANEIYNDALKYEKEGAVEEAKNYFYLAKDLDCIRFRASEEINEVIRSLAKRYEATLVSMQSSFFEEVSPNNLIGNNLMTEHVHPDIDGYFLMADAFFYFLAEARLLDEKLNIVYYKNSQYYQNNWGYTELDSLLGVHRVNSVKFYWPFQPFDAPFVDYREIYKPISLIDSLAFSIIQSPENTTNEAHLKMAEFYKERGDYYKAYREYHAAIRCNPYRVQDYLEAINCLVKINDYALALKFIDKSLALQESFYAWFVKSEILSMKGDYIEASDALNKARELDRNNENTERILIKLYETYYYSGDDKKAAGILNELRQINSDYQPAIQKDKPVYVNFLPIQVENQIREAIAFYKTGNDDAALDILQKTLEIKETAIANRIIGDILLRRGDKNSILFYLKAYPDYNKDINFLYDLGILYLNHGVLDEAQEILDEMTILDPDYQKTKLFQEKIGRQ